MNVLFICKQNLNRSKTAEEIFKDRFNTKSAGLFNERPVTKIDLEWADLIFVMEDFQRTEISKRFPELYMKKQILSLDIPDTFCYMKKDLISLLNEKINQAILTIH